MNTIIIYDQCGAEPLSFYFLEGDYNHLNGIYVNQAAEDEDLQETHEAKQEELMELLKDKEPTKHFPLDKVDPYDTSVIVCGFLY